MGFAMNNSWLKENTFHYSEFGDLSRLVDEKQAKNLKISLCLPTLNEEETIAKEIIMSYVKKAVGLGGTISAEHGVGKIKHDYLKELYGDTGINEMIRIKKTFDPGLILNQNNIFKTPHVD